MKLRQVVMVALGVGVTFSACTRVELSDQPPPVTDVGGFAGEADGGAGSLPGNGGGDSGGMGVEGGGAPASVELGIWPTYAARGDDDQVGAVLASVAALSAGSLTLPIYERWDELSGATGSPRAVTWARLDAMIAPYRERSANVALCVGLVDRQDPAWPVAQLDDEDAERAIERTIDEVYTRYAPQLSHLCFGHEVDRFLAVAEAEEGEQLLALLGHAVDYAQRHPLRAARTTVSTSITLSALATETEVLLKRLLLGDEVGVVYDALDDEGSLKDPEAIAVELEAGLEVLTRLADQPQSLALLEAGYPSAGATGATERAQSHFYEALFDAVDAHRSQFSFIGVFGLGDRSARDCDVEAAAFEGAAAPGEPVASVRSLARCHMGLRADAGESGESAAEKPAWDVVSRAISLYR